MSQMTVGTSALSAAPEWADLDVPDFVRPRSLRVSQGAAQSARPVRVGQLRRPSEFQSAQVYALPKRGAAARGAARVAPVRPSAGAGVRLTRRGQIVVRCLGVALVLLVVLGSAVAFARLANADAAVTGSSATERRIVLPGETYWSIAASLARPGQDTGDVVAVLESLNPETSTLQSGQVLRIPL